MTTLKLFGIEGKNPLPASQLRSFLKLFGRGKVMHPSPNLYIVASHDDSAASVHARIVQRLGSAWSVSVHGFSKGRLVGGHREPVSPESLLDQHKVKRRLGRYSRISKRSHS